MKKLGLFLVILLAIHASLLGQIGNLGKKLREKAGEVLKEKIEEEKDKKRDSYDTTSFIYSIALLDKSESFAATQRGEKLFKTADILLSDDSEKTEKEKARDIYEVGRLAYNRRRYVLATVYLNSAKAAFEIINQENDPVYLKTIGTLGLLYTQMGLYGISEEYTNKAMQGWSKSLGESSSGYLAEKNNLAVLYMNLAKFNESEKILRELVNETAKNQGMESEAYAIAINNLGILHLYMGRTGEALEEVRNCIEIAKKAFKDNSSTNIQIMTNLALILQEDGQYEAAEETYLKAIDLQLNRMKLNKTSDPDYAHMLNNLASLYTITDRYDEAENLLRESLGIYKSKFGSSNLNTANAQLDLGNLLRIKGSLEESATKISNALSRFTDLYGPDHPKTVEALESEAIVDWLSGNLQDAEKKFDKVMNGKRAFINEFFPPMSEADKTSYWDKVKSSFNLYYNFAFSVGSQELINKALNHRLATKGILLSSTTKIKETILKGDDEELKTLYAQWENQKNLLSVYYSLSKKEVSDQNINIDSLESEANQTEKLLSEKSSEFSEAFLPHEVDYLELTEILDENETLIEIIKYPVFSSKFDGNSNYAAFVVSGTGDPQLVKFQNGDMLDSRYLAYYNNTIRQKIDDQFSYDQFWVPMSSSVQNKTVLYFSGDGVFNQMNLNTLRDQQGTFLLEKLDIRYIGHPLDLLNRSQSERANSALLVGYPDYGSSDIPELPGTLEEINQVKDVLGNSFAVETKLESSANEKSIKTADQPGVLHIATHGFFLQDVENSGGVFGVEISYAKNNPLLRSGLMLAGASEASSYSLEDDDNGILTAYEALNLNLNQTELVVLSACETGKGDIKAGEGVYGLQRAFQIAGGNNLLMSLWKVDDAATQKLMTNFYHRWISNGEELSVAFRQAQLDIMKEYNHPNYWGAFVLLNR